MQKIAIIGAGLAGCEAALVLASPGVAVSLYEMRPQTMTPAHKTGMPAELICSNSLKSDQLPSAHGLLKAELDCLKSPLYTMAKECRVPAGTAVAVDREVFSQKVLVAIEAHPHITYIKEEVAAPPPDANICIIAAGPLVSERLANWLLKEFSAESLSFYDAIAPIISADSIDRSKVFFASRWNKSGADYGNCPFTEEEYLTFYNALTEADKVVARDFEDKRFFEACLPIEVVAARDVRVLTFGTMRPVGLIDPNTGKEAYAICQLRKENVSGDAYNLVGFQTRLTIPEQKRVFRLIPGLEQAEFLRFGSIHRNTYLHSPSLLNSNLSFKKRPNLFLAGQLCGNEGYTESIATGHLAARYVTAQTLEKKISPLPTETACGALLRHITASEEKQFSPSNIHFGLFDAITVPGKKRVNKGEKRKLLCERALASLKGWISENSLE